MGRRAFFVLFSLSPPILSLISLSSLSQPRLLRALPAGRPVQEQKVPQLPQVDAAPPGAPRLRLRERESVWCSCVCRFFLSQPINTLSPRPLSARASSRETIPLLSRSTVTHTRALGHTKRRDHNNTFSPEQTTHRQERRAAWEGGRMARQPPARPARSSTGPALSGASYGACCCSARCCRSGSAPIAGRRGKGERGGGVTGVDGGVGMGQRARAHTPARRLCSYETLTGSGRFCLIFLARTRLTRKVLCDG